MMGAVLSFSESVFLIFSDLTVAVQAKNPK